MEDFDTIINWSNKLGNSYNTKYIQACAECQSLKAKGFTRDEAEEILAGSGHGLKGLKTVLAEVFGETKKQYAKREAYVVPTSYDDVLHIVEANLLKDGPKKFVEEITSSEHPIVEASDLHKKNLLKIANSCYENVSLMKHLHNELRPFFEEIMLNSVLEAEQNKGSIKKLSQSQYEVKIGAKTAKTNLMEGLSSGEKFQKGNYAKFGLADEFLVMTHDQVSPYNRILKALSD